METVLIVAQIALIVLQLTGVVSLPWVVVFLPLIIIAGCLLFSILWVKVWLGIMKKFLEQ